MAEITINGVKYTNVPNKKAGTKFAASLTQSNIGASQAVQDYVNSAYFYPLVNAIDINWNGVEVDDNSYINSTSDLITYIATKGSSVDLTSYATKNYVDQKITDLIGGAPETLDTLKELADALEDDASLAYVTQALDGKADKSSLTNYATNSYVTTELDKKADKSQLPDMNNYSTVSYVTTELDKKANKNEIPSMPDLTPYATTSYVTTELDKKADKSSLNDYATNSYVTIELDKKADKTDIPVAPDMSNYVTVTAYNMLVQRVDELAYLISYYHPTPEPTPTPTPTFEFTYGTGSIWTVYNSGMDSVAQWLNNTTGYTANYSSDNANVMVDPSTGVLSWTIGSQNATITATANAGMYTTSMYVYTDIQSKLTPTAQWTANGMNYSSSIILSQSQGLTTLTFSGTPLSGWTFTDPMISGITVDTSTGSITVSPSYASSGTYYVSVSYPGDATYNSYSGTFTITVESGKQSAIGNWYDSNNVMTSNKAVVSGDTTTYTFTFQSTPASGWTFGNPMMTGITVDQSNGTITIDPTNMGETSSPINVTASYMEDSSYWGSMASFSIKVLPAGANPDFYYEQSSINLSNTMPSQSPMIRTSLTYDHIDYRSSNTTVATVNNYGTIEYVGPGECSVSAYAFDSNDYEMANAFITVYCTHQKNYPSCKWYDSNHVLQTSKAIAYGDNTSYTFTFDGTPLTGWTFTETHDNRVTVNSSGDITIDPTQGSGTGQVTQFVSYTEDSDYYQGGGSFRVIFLEQGADPKFYFEDPSIYLYVGQTRYPMIHCDYMYNTRSITSSDTNVATVNGMGEIQYVGGGTCTITATIYDSNNAVISTATMSVECESPAPTKIDPTAQWTANGMNYSSSIILSKSQGLTTLTFSGTPLSGWTFTGPAVTGITVDTSTGSITVDPASYGESTSYNVTATYPGDATYNNYSMVFNIKVDKQMPSFQWYNNSHLASECVVNLGSSGTEVFNYDATPIDGWTITGDNGTSIVLDTSLKTLTIDKSNLSTRGNNVILARRDEDSSYYSSMNIFNVTVIPAGESTDFFFRTQGVSMSPSFASMSLMLMNYTGIDTKQYPINYSSSDTSVATVDNYGTVTYVAAGNAIVTATLSDGNNSYTATASVECTSN